VSSGVQQFYGSAVLIVLALMGYGVYGVVTNSDSAAYEAASKELVDAKIISTGGGSETCFVTVDQHGETFTLSTPALAGACDDNSVLKPGVNVQIEYWNGKATAIYDDALSWPTVDNPGNKAALAYAAVFFGALIGAVVAGIGAVHFLVWFSTRQLRKRSA